MISRLCLALLLLAAAGCRPPAPDLLLVTADTLRADRLGAYGSAGTRTPTLDALAARGVRFARAYTTYPKTAPALASLMTGAQPSQHGVRANGVRLADEWQTLAERLRAAGYDTRAFVSSHVVTSRSGLEQGFDHYDERLPDPVPTRDTEERTASSLVDAVAAGIDGLRRPYFLWVHFIDPHGPYTPPGYREQAPALEAQRPAGPRLETSASNYARDRIPAYQVLPGLRAVHAYTTLYEQEVDFVDRELARLFAVLEERDLLAGAVVAFTADHGEALGEHGYFFQHGNTLLEPELRVPLLVAGPGLPPGVVEGPVSTAQLLPSLLSWLGVPGDPKPLGAAIDLRAEATADRPHRPLLAELEDRYAVIEGDLKLVWRAPGGSAQLYDLASDPEEVVDLAERRPRDAARLRSVAQAVAASREEEAPPPADPETRRMLQALGYLDE